MPTKLTSRLVIVTLFVMSLLLTIPVLGAENNGLSASVTCTGFTLSGGLTANRDNTGSGQESIVINAVDGTGNNVYQLVDAIPLNWQVSFGNAVYGWRDVPAANPITLSIISIGGNNLSQEVLYTASGNCDGLQQGTAPDLTASVNTAVSVGSGSTSVSPSVPIGGPVPVPSTSAAVIESLPYYAIVNTTALNLRSGTGPQYTVVAVLTGGTRAAVIGRNKNRSWWLLEAGGYRGWASNDFIALRGDLVDVPEVPNMGELQPITLVTSLTQSVFSEANNFNINKVCDIPPGEYAVIGKDRYNVFYEIAATCTDGNVINAWIKGDEGAFRNPAALSLPITDGE